MEADNPHFVDLPQPLGRDGYISNELAGMLHPDQVWLGQRRFRGAKYSPLANGYSMLTIEGETGTWYLVFDEGGSLLPDFHGTSGQAMNTAEEHHGARKSSNLKH